MVLIVGFSFSRRLSIFEKINALFCFGRCFFLCFFVLCLFSRLFVSLEILDAAINICLSNFVHRGKFRVLKFLISVYLLTSIFHLFQAFVHLISKMLNGGRELKLRWESLDTALHAAPFKVDLVSILIDIVVPCLSVFHITVEECALVFEFDLIRQVLSFINLFSFGLFEVELDLIRSSYLGFLCGNPCGSFHSKLCWVHRSRQLPPVESFLWFNGLLEESGAWGVTQ